MSYRVVSIRSGAPELWETVASRTAAALRNRSIEMRGVIAQKGVVIDVDIFVGPSDTGVQGADAVRMQFRAATVPE